MKISVLFIAAFIAGTIITFSQTPENAPAEVNWIVKPLELPADNVELVSTDGRSITASVLSKSDTGITIRNPEGKEVEIAWGKLSPATFEKINGKKTTQKSVVDTWKEIERETFARKRKQPSTTDFKNEIEWSNAVISKLEKSTAQTNSERQFKETAIKLYKVGVETNELSMANPKLANSDKNKIWEAERKLSAKEAQSLVLNETNNNTFHQQFRLKIEGRSTSQKMMGLLTDPNWCQYNLTPLDILPKLEIKPLGEEEAVSLQKKCEELGVTPTKQIEDTCTLYATQHMLQYACRVAGLTPPTIDALKTACIKRDSLRNAMGGRYGHEEMQEEGIPKTVKKRPITQWIESGHTGINQEIAKHEIRNGRLVMANSGAHAIVLVGFTTNKEGKTTWTFINSNGVERNGGYHSTQQVNPIYSIRFE